MSWPFKRKIKRIKRELSPSEFNEIGLARKKLKRSAEKAHAVKTKLSETNDILNELCEELLREI